MNEINSNRIKGKISICSLAYNHFDYLDDFFKGVLNQHIANYKTEIIIGIDNCTDNTLEKCVEYKTMFPDKIKLLIHPHRVGMMTNFIQVLASTDGEYIAFCECDDYWVDENKLSAQMDLLQENRKAGICFTDIKILKSGKGTFEKNWATITKKEYSLKDIIKDNVISNCTVLMKNNIDAGILDHLKKFEVGDWPLYMLSMYKDNFSAVFLDKVTTIYRHHDGGFHSTKNTIQRLRITNSVYIALLEIFKFSPIKNLIMRELSKNFYSMGVFQTDKNDARSNYIFSMKQCNFLNIKFPLFSSLRLLKSFL